MKAKDFWLSTDKKVFYDWMGMYFSNTFKEGAEGDNFLAFNMVKNEIADEICRNVERMWEEMQENEQDSICDWWEGATQYAYDLIEKKCNADSYEREAIFTALKYNIMDIDFNGWVDVCHVVEVTWRENDIEVEIKEEEEEV